MLARSNFRNNEKSKSPFNKKAILFFCLVFLLFNKNDVFADGEKISSNGRYYNFFHPKISSYLKVNRKETEQVLVSSAVNENSAIKNSKVRDLDTPPCLTWVDPDIDNPKAAILCVHGLGLHNGTYEKFGIRMSKLGYIVYSVDVRGFGSYRQAEGRSKVDFDKCLNDIHKTLQNIHRANRNLPVFILGESMGGAIALRYTALHPDMIDGLISSVPSGDRFKQGKTKLKVALKLLTSPNKDFDIGSSVVKQATDDEKLREQWSKDPLARMNLSPVELLQFQEFMNENHESVKLIKKTPVLMVQGCHDKLVKFSGTESLFNGIANEDKKFAPINAEHLIFEEAQFNDEVIQLTDHWINDHLKKAVNQ